MTVSLRWRAVVLAAVDKDPGAVATVKARLRFHFGDGRGFLHVKESPCTA
jgi:hypothetical protein